jgi:hypothetical protein
MCDNCGCGSSATMMNVSVNSAMAGLSDSSTLGTDTTDMTVQSAPKNTIGN